MSMERKRLDRESKTAPASRSVPPPPITTGLTSPPARPSRAARTGTAKGVNFSLFSEAPNRSSCACSTPTGQRTAHPHPRAHQRGLAHLRARHRAGPALRLPRARPLRSGKRAALQSEQAAARSLCQGDRPRLNGRTSCSATRWAIRTATCPSTTATARRSRPWAAVIDPASTGAARSGRRTGARDHHLRGARARHDHAASGRARELRGTYAGMASRAHHRASAAAGASPRSN
jgi:hypothetical protein